MFIFLFFFKQKTSYEMRISDWSSDVCSSDLRKRFVSSSFVSHFFHFFLSWPSRKEVMDEQSEDLLNSLVKVDDFASEITEIGRASCRERVCKYVSISVVAVSLKKK